MTDRHKFETGLLDVDINVEEAVEESFEVRVQDDHGYRQGEQVGELEDQQPEHRGHLRLAENGEAEEGFPGQPVARGTSGNEVLCKRKDENCHFVVNHKLIYPCYAISGLAADLRGLSSPTGRQKTAQSKSQRRCCHQVIDNADR